MILLKILLVHLSNKDLCAYELEKLNTKKEVDDKEVTSFLLRGVGEEKELPKYKCHKHRLRTWVRISAIIILNHIYNWLGLLPGWVPGYPRILPKKHVFLDAFSVFGYPTLIPLLLNLLQEWRLFRLLFKNLYFYLIKPVQIVILQLHSFFH